VKKFLNIVARRLMDAAHNRALHLIGEQAAATRPWEADFRSNAGGWN
jgi:hypothetical protein